jgi:hypothetical protein
MRNDDRHLLFWQTEDCVTPFIIWCLFWTDVSIGCNFITPKFTLQWYILLMVFFLLLLHRSDQRLNLVGNPGQLLKPSQTPTMSCEYLSLDTMERWIICECSQSLLLWSTKFASHMHNFVPRFETVFSFTWYSLMHYLWPDIFKIIFASKCTDFLVSALHVKIWKHMCCLHHLAHNVFPGT